MASRSVLRSTLRAHLLLRHNNNKPSLSNPLFQDSSLETLKPFSSSSSFTISNHNLFFSPSRSFSSSFPTTISQGETIKRKPGRPRKIRPDDETVSLESSTTPSSLSSLSQTQKRGRGRPPGSGKKKEVELESSPVSSPLSLSLSQTHKRGRGRPPGSGKKEEVELESAPVSSSLSQTQKRGRGRPLGSGKMKKEAANEDDSADEIRSECEAKYAARKIFNNVSKPHSKFIYLDDLLRFMADDEAARTMDLFEGVGESKRVNKKTLKN